jgi:stage III sporulation protein SpoIIIAA
MAGTSIDLLTRFLLNRRIGIDGTLHRLSVILSHQTGTDGMPPVIGVTARVGKTVEGMVDALVPDLFSSNEVRLDYMRGPYLSSNTVREDIYDLIYDLR